MPEEVLVISLGTGPQTVPGMMSENEVMCLELMYCWRDDGVINSASHFCQTLKGVRLGLLGDSVRHFIMLSVC